MAIKKKKSKKVAPVVDNDQGYENLKKLVIQKVEDGDLSDQDVTDITMAIEERSYEKRLTDAQGKELLTLAREGVQKNGATRVPLLLKIWAVVSFVSAFVLLPLSVLGLQDCMNLLTNGENQYSATELLITMLQFCLVCASCVLHFLLSIRLFKNNRYRAGRIVNILMALSAVAIFNAFMISGFSEYVVLYTVALILQVALSGYLSPSLARERKLEENIRMADTKQRAEAGTLGLDLDGKGYIKLDFFNIFWIFIIGCVLGLIVEIIWHMVVVDPGVYQDRAGLMWGPFSPIYGVGCVLMTIALNRFKNMNIFLIFVICTIIGGAFEYLVSWWMEVAFGAIAWDYSDKFLNINGRTCLAFASMFGFLGLAWIKLLLPIVLKCINRIPWKIRYSVTAVCAFLMLFNCAVTVIALDCWYERVAGIEPVSEVQVYYAENFPNDVMQNRFQSMTINPQGGHSN